VNAVEFGLLLPIFTALLLGSLEFGWVFYLDSVMNAAVAEGCREASLLDPGSGDGSAQQVLERAGDEMFAALSKYGAGDCTNCTAFAQFEGESPSRTLYCEATWTVTPLLGLSGSEITLSASTLTLLEWQR
jgi:Flp pilus assembly protein TadG